MRDSPLRVFEKAHFRVRFFNDESAFGSGRQLDFLLPRHHAHQFAAFQCNRHEPVRSNFILAGGANPVSNHAKRSFII